MRLIKRLNPLYNIIFFSILLFSCDQNKEYQVSNRGVYYKFIEKKSREPVSEGEVVKINMLYKTKEGNVIADSELMGGAFYMQYVDSIWQNSGLFYKGLTLLGEGDSAEFMIPAENFYEVTANDNVPDHIHPDDSLIFLVGIEEVLSVNEYKRKIREQKKK